MLMAKQYSDAHEWKPNFLLSTPEGGEQFFDYLKHLTTLSTGSILLEVAFLEKVFSHPKWKACAVISLLSFMISVMASIVVYWHSLMMTFSALGKTDIRRILLLVGLIFTFSGFVLGIVSLTVFAIANLLIL